MMTFIKLSLFSALLFFAVTSIAQVDTIRTDDIEIIKEYTPFLEEGKKQSFTPTMPAIIPSNRENLAYDVPPQFIETTYQPDEIKPLPIDIKDDVSQSNFYFKGGYGTSSNPLGQLAISGSRANDYSAGFLGDFQAVKGNLYDDQKSSATDLKLFGTKEIEGASLDGALTYKNNSDWLYGRDHQFDDVTFFDSKQAMSNFGIDLGLQSVTNDEWALGYEVGGAFNIISDRLYDFNESRINITSGLKQRIFDNVEAELLLGAEFRTSKSPMNTLGETKVSETVLNATPIVKPELGNVSLELGASLNNDKLNGFKFFPHVGVELPFANDTYTFFAGWKGKTVMNGFQELSEINTRMNSDTSPFNYTQEVRTPGGIKGALNQDLAFNLSVSQIVTKNASLFTTLPIAELPPGDFSAATFSVVQEEKLTNWQPSLILNYQLGDQVNALANINYNFYKTKTEVAAWHKPKLDAGLDLTFKPLENLNITTSFNSMSGIKYQTAANEEESLKSIFNANLGASYNVTENIAVFIDGNNLTNQKFQQWINYPSIGTNVLAGVVLSY